MKPYLVKTPKFVARIFPKRIWAFSNTPNSIYLTFDDGPIPEVTPWVLDMLKEYNAKATFFCIGENIEKHSTEFKRIISEGHHIGNHTFNHLNGWNTATAAYLKNTAKVEPYMAHSLLFRPPYGRLKPQQAKALLGKGYKIVMWDVLCADFDTNTSAEKCLSNVLLNMQPGSIVVFHDSLKAEKNLRYSFPRVLQYISEKGWTCEAIPQD